MYTRSYSDKESPVSIPENYDGTAFGENTKDFESEEAFSPLTNKFSLKSLFPEGGILGSLKKSFPRISSPKIGTEEILLAALALYLFLSKDGDKECAVILLILLLIN